MDVKADIGVFNAELYSEIARIVGAENIKTDKMELAAYQQDASPIQALPLAVVFPKSAEQISQIVKVCNTHHTPFVAWGAGTGLSGGAIADGFLLLACNRMNTILQVNEKSMLVEVQAGATNYLLNQQALQHGLRFAPDLSGSKSSTIGGNIAENACGEHVIIDGPTQMQILGLEVILPDGTMTEMGGGALDIPGYDLASLVTGSEGTLGIISRATCLLRTQFVSTQTYIAGFRTINDAASASQELYRQGIIPAILEMMDHRTSLVADEAVNAGYPPSSGSILLIELAGLPEEFHQIDEAIQEIFAKFDMVSFERAQDQSVSLRWWQGRAIAFGAVGQYYSQYFAADCTVPVSKVQEALLKIGAIARKQRIRILSIAHLGNGNLHPLILYSPEDQNESDQAREVLTSILKLAVSLGGTISGDHGIGALKRGMLSLQYPESSIHEMFTIKQNFDPNSICNPGKIFGRDESAHGLTLTATQSGGW